MGSTDVSDDRRRSVLDQKEEAGLSFQQIADRTTYSKATVYRVLTGQESSIPINRGKVLAHVEDALGR